MGLMTACGNTNNNKPETPEKLVMTAPHVEVDETGLIFLDEFPQTDPHLTVQVNDDFTVANIYYDGKLIQTIEDEFGLASEEAPVHYLDANYDGLTDIYSGPGVSRTLNSLLVWDEFEQQFQVVEGSSLQNPMLHPSTEGFIDGGSSSYCETDITFNMWDGSMLIADESLSIVLDPEQYEEIGVENVYTLRDDNDKVLYSTDNFMELPEMWQIIIMSYGFNPEVEDAN